MPSGLRLYTASADEDLLIASWYLRMANDGDLDKLFTSGSRTMAELFRLVGRPKTLIYAVDASGIWFAMWAEAMLAGAFVGIWVRQPLRHTRQMLNAFLDAHAWYFTGSLCALFGVTKQPKILDEVKQFGYSVLDCTDGLWDGEDAWIVKLTRKRFMETLNRYRRPSMTLVETGAASGL